MDKNNDKLNYVEDNKDEVQILLESYQLADSQLQMRIQQRDNFAIQLMVALGVIIGVITATKDLIIVRLAILLTPIICSYFCNQILSSYEVHHRLSFYMKNVIEKTLEKRLSNNLILWENFCQFDRDIIKKTKIGGREDFFKKINLVVPVLALISNIAIIICSEQYSRLGSLLLFEWYDYLICMGGLLSIVWACKIHKRYSCKEGYENTMSNKIALCGYINKKRTDYMQKKRAVFLDRDGTIIVDKVETRKIEDLEFFNDIDCLKKLKDAGFLLIIITNQSGIGKGNYTVEEMQKFNDHMISELSKKKILIDALYYCPHKSEDNCQCKKPKDGMIRRAQMDLNIDLSKSVLIGDQNSDIMAGINAGLMSCYAVTTGLYPQNKTSRYQVDYAIADKTIVCDNLQEATKKILANEFCVNDD